MLVRIFRSNQPGVLVLLALLVPALFLKHWLAPPPDLSSGMPLARVFMALFEHVPWAYGTMVALCVASLAVLVSVVMNEAELTDRRNHLPILLVPLALALTVPPGGAGAAFFGLPFVMWAMQRTWSISSGGTALGPLFDAGLLLGVAVLFHVPYAFVLVVVWSSVSVIRPFQWREYLLTVLGMALVCYLGWGVMRLAHLPIQAPLRTVVGSTIGLGQMPRGHGWSLALLAVPLLLVSALRFMQQYDRGVVREQNVRSAFIAFGLTMGLLGALVRWITGVFPAVFVALPLAMLATFGLLGQRKAWLGELAVGCLLLLALWIQYAPG